MSENNKQHFKSNCLKRLATMETQDGNKVKSPQTGLKSNL